MFIFVKTIHEFGHGLTCKHFGGEVHEMGAMFIMFTPYLYCNVSDSWLLPDKTRRILVTAAGIFVEMTLAIVAAWVWMVTAPGLLHQICFNIMFTCSVSTVLFNANPLMKFDGYYMMADALEVPNLKQKSAAAASGWAQRYLLGLRGGRAGAIFLVRVRARCSDCTRWRAIFTVGWCSTAFPRTCSICSRRTGSIS